MYVTRNGNTVSKLTVIVTDKFGLNEVILILKKPDKQTNNKHANKQNNNSEKLVAYERCRFVCNTKLEKANRTRDLFDKLASHRITILLGREKIISKLVICLRNHE